MERWDYMEDCPNYPSTAEIVKMFHQSAAKTPYQLDLEVKDRKPNIVPKVGDKVKIKSKEWYEKWKDDVHKFVWIEGLEYFFANRMSCWCGDIMKVTAKGNDGTFRLEGSYSCWHSEFFEEVYPQESESTCVHTVKLGGDTIHIKVSKLDDPKEPKLKMIINNYIKLNKL